MRNMETSRSKYTQHSEIKKYLVENKTMTPMDAWNKLRITKLSTRIGEMERKGMLRTEHKMETNPMTGARYMRYTLLEDDVNG